MTEEYIVLFGKFVYSIKELMEIIEVEEMTKEDIL